MGMKKHIVIDGNAFYEVDEDCLEEKRRQGQQMAGHEKRQNVCREAQQAARQARQQISRREIHQEGSK